MWRIRDVYPGSDFFPCRIRTVPIPDPGSSSKNLSILTPKKAKKWFLSSKKYDPGCLSWIRMLTFYPSRIQGSKRHPIPDPEPQHYFYRFLSEDGQLIIFCCNFLTFWSLKTKKCLYVTVYLIIKNSCAQKM